MCGGKCELLMQSPFQCSRCPLLCICGPEFDSALMGSLAIQRCGDLRREQEQEFSAFASSLGLFFVVTTDAGT